MKRRYNPSCKEFMIFLVMLIIGALLFILALNTKGLTVRTICVIVGLVLILYSVARIMRIFLKIFLDQIRGW